MTSVPVSISVFAALPAAVAVTAVPVPLLLVASAAPAFPAIIISPMPIAALGMLIFALISDLWFS
jgi:hypothetical protein